MLGLLRLDGYQLIDEPDGADFVIVNTCGFIEQAREESFSAIDEMLELKTQGRIRGVIVAGCLAERQKEEILQQRPGIDSLVGVFARDEITRVADRLVGDLDEQQTVFRPAPIQPLEDTTRFRVTPKHFAYIKISEGCDRLCTFCAIPKMRGKHASKPIDQVVRETQQLAADGVRELILVAQDLTYYGLDLYEQPRLAQLLGELDKVEGIKWIRLMYLYPMYIDEGLLEAMANSSKIVPYIDIPLQHANDDLLRRMARRVTRRETEEILQRLRERIPDLVLRTTLIAGFPGETDDQFDELVDFVKQQQFQRLGAFVYSPEPDTPAARMPDQLPAAVKAARRDRLMEVQQEIAFAWNHRQVGRQLDVILDMPVQGEDNVWVGRSYADAPDIDGVVYVTGEDASLSTGDVVACEIVTSRGYDLVGVAVGSPG